MKKLIITIIFMILSLGLISQSNQIKNNFDKINQQEAVWDNGVPILPDDDNIMNLIYQLNQDAITDVNKLTKEQVRIYRELGIEFYNKGMYSEADFYLSKIKNYSETKNVKLKEVFKEDNSQIRKEIKEEFEKKYQEEIEKIKSEPKTELSETQKTELEKDKNFTKSLPNTIDELSKEDLEQLSKKIENQIQKLTKERDELVRNNGSQELIESKNTNIKSLKKEKEVINLSIDNVELKEEKTIIQRWLWVAIISVIVLILFVLVLLQRKTIKVQDVEIENQLSDIKRKNTYLEHAARIIRHDIHSGINTYIPRGITSLEKRLTSDDIKNLKLENPLKMIKEGLSHTQRVYKSVYEFTNLVKKNVVLEKKQVDLKLALQNYLSNTSYSNDVVIEDLITVEVNEVLFCTAIDNLIRNGLKYNNSIDKEIKIFIENQDLVIEDNGIGFSQDDLENIRKTKRKDKDEESGLGLNICLAILNEHGFDLSCEKLNTGTKMKIKLK